MHPRVTNAPPRFGRLIHVDQSQEAEEKIGELQELTLVKLMQKEGVETRAKTKEGDCQRLLSLWEDARESKIVGARHEQDEAQPNTDADILYLLSANPRLGIIRRSASCRRLTWPLWG